MYLGNNIFLNSRRVCPGNLPCDEIWVLGFVHFPTGINFLSIDFFLYKGHILPGPTFHLANNSYFNAAEFPYLWQHHINKDSPQQNESGEKALHILSDSDDFALYELVRRELGYDFFGEDTNYLDVSFVFGNLTQEFVSMKHREDFSWDEFFFENPIIKPLPFDRPTATSLVFSLTRTAQILSYFSGVYLDPTTSSYRNRLNMFFHVAGLSFHCSFCKQVSAMINSFSEEKDPNEKLEFFFDLVTTAQTFQNDKKTALYRFLLENEKKPTPLTLTNDLASNLLNRMYYCLCNQNSCYIKHHLPDKDFTKGSREIPDYLEEFYHETENS